MAVDANRAFTTAKHLVRLFLVVTKFLERKVKLCAAAVGTDICKSRMRVLEAPSHKRSHTGAGELPCRQAEWARLPDGNRATDWERLFPGFTSEDLCNCPKEITSACMLIRIL